MVVEIRDPESKEFIFPYKEVKILRHGKCEYCYGHKALTVECKC